MKCVEKDKTVLRVKENEVDQALKNGWKLCPKWKWKEHNGKLYRGKKP